MIRVAVLDRHPAVRAGIAATLQAQPDMAPAGSAAHPSELWPLLYRTDPDVLLLDHDLRSGDGLALCLRITSRPLAPYVVICASDGATSAIVPATLAGAGALVDKAADLRELLHAVRAVARGERVLPCITPPLQARAAGRLDARDRAIFAMRLAGTAPRDIAATVGLSAAELDARTAAIVARLAAADDPAPPAQLWSGAAA